MNQDLSKWRSLLSRNPISKGPRITDGAGDASSANWTIPQSKDLLKSLRQMWIKRILTTKLHTKVVDACRNHQSEPFVSEDELAPFLDDIQHSFPSISLNFTIPNHQPFRLHLLHSLLLLSKDPDPQIATLLQEGIPSGAFSQLEPVGLWETNCSIPSDYPDLVVCHDNWTSANHNPDTTRLLIQKELDDGFIEELPDIATAEQRWPKGIALGKLGVVHADNRDPRLVLDSTICGMNGRCHLPEKQRLPNLRHISFFLSSCPPLQDEWQGASIDIKAAHKRMLIREDERGSLLFKFDGRLFAYRSAHFGAKTSAWHWGRVSGAILRLLHSLLFFRHAAWVYVDDFFLLFPKSTSAVQFTLAIILLRIIGAPLSWKKLEFDKTIDWNGWTINPGTMIAQLPSSKQEKIRSLIAAVLQSPSRKNLEKIIGILLWATSLVHHVRFLLTSLYRDLYAIPATNYSINPTEWESFLHLLNDAATITQHNHLHLPVGSRVVEFKHSTISSKSQLPSDIPIERHVWIRLRDPNCEKRRLSDTSKKTLLWSKESLLPLLKSIPLNRSTQMTVTAAADAFATEDQMGIGGWIKLETNVFWFSHIWNREELQPLLDTPKSLQRYISSWEALAQLCILLLVNQKCSTRPGIISIQSGSDNTGAEANINHGFSNTEVLSDIIKLVSIQQIQCNIFLNIHHIPGEKNTDADDLSRGRTTNFCQSSRVLINLVEIFNPLPFPRYINTSVQWDLELHANAKHFFFVCCFLDEILMCLFPLFLFSLFFLSSSSFFMLHRSHFQFQSDSCSQSLWSKDFWIGMFQTFLFLRTSMMNWNLSLDPGSSPRNPLQLQDHLQNQALFLLLAKHHLRSLLSRPLLDQDHAIFPRVKLMHYHLLSSGWNLNLRLSTLEVWTLQFCIPSLHQQRQWQLQLTHQSWGSFKLRPSAYPLLPGFIILPEPRRQLKPKNQPIPTGPRTASKRSSTTLAFPANTSSESVKASEQEAFLCIYKFGTTGHVGATYIQLYQLRHPYLLYWTTFTPPTFSRRKRTWNPPEQECLHISRL